MALSRPLLLQFRSQQPLLAPTNFNFNFNFFSDLAESRAPDAPCPASLNLLLRSNISVPVLKPKVVVAGPVKCFARSTEEKQCSDAETVVSDSDEAASEDEASGNGQLRRRTSAPEADRAESRRVATAYFGDSLSLGIREPVYEVRSYKLFFTSELY